MIESALSSKVKKYIQSIGGRCVKLGGAKGIPDRLCILDNGISFYYEIKISSGTLSKAQKVWVYDLISKGHSVLVTDSYEDLLSYTFNLRKLNMQGGGKGFFYIAPKFAKEMMDFFEAIGLDKNDPVWKTFL